MFFLSLSQQKAIKNYQNFLAEDSKDQYIGINIKKSENYKRSIVIERARTKLAIFIMY